ncbi:MAG: TatD family hydrolase [Planctomycetes bacterium]|nr:TatD family hydrolase [Planctomycetota bacterium]
MLIDSHCHVSTPRYEEDRDQVLARAREAGLIALIDVGCDVASSEASLALARSSPMVFAAVGVHPHEAKFYDETTPDALRRMAADPRVVAIGEMGLDFHYDHSPRDVQRRVFRLQLELARSLDMPVVLHIREAYEEGLALIDELNALPGPALRGVSHCFTGNATQALGFSERGFGVSFTGVVTFKKALDLQEAARAIPLESVLVETDCPYMSPVPLRGKRCEPAFVVHTARKVAELRGISEAELEAATVQNTIRVFGLPGDLGAS